MKTKKIRIRIATGATHVPAYVFSKWAAHEGLGPDGPDWVVTLVGDGRRLRGVFTRGDAIAVAETLDGAGLRTLRACQRNRWLVEAIVAEAAA